jgi:hypothetical protein
MAEQIAASEGNNAPIHSVYTPQIGMEFKSKDLAQYFFDFYAWLAGFKFTVKHTFRTTSKKKDNEIYKFELRCTHSGKPKAQKTTEHQEAEVDKGIGKKTDKKRKTNVI